MLARSGSAQPETQRVYPAWRQPHYVKCRGLCHGYTAYPGSSIYIVRLVTLSFGNVLLIARQKPDATKVAGMFTWNQLGRRVKRGEKGIAILAPMIGKRRKKQNTDTGTEEEANNSTLLGFRRVYVWDRLSRDLWPSLCALDGSRRYHFRKSPR